MNYKIRVIPPSIETLQLGRRRRAKSTLDLVESKLSSRRGMLETLSSQLAVLEQEATEIQNKIKDINSKLELIRADEENLKKLLVSKQQYQRPRSNWVDINSDRFLK